MNEKTTVKPADYDVAGWQKFYAENPGYHRSVGADGDGDGGDGGEGGDGDDVSSAVKGQWYEPIAGDDESRIETLKAYDSPDKFFEEFDGLKNRNWRTELAGEDEKLAKQLERFSSPAEFAKSYQEAQQKIRSGELQKPPGKDADEKDIAAYREANGIPAEAKGYLEKLPDGLVIGEDDMPVAERFANALHAANAPPEYMHALLGEYNKLQEEEQDALAEADAAHHQETEDLLRTEWAGDYRANINLIGSLLESTFGAEAKDKLLNGRYPDGRGFMNDPDILRGLSDLARKMNPLMELTKPGGDPQQSLNDEIAEIEKFMRTNRAEYDKDNEKQLRLRHLYDLRIKHAEQRKSA